MDFLMLKIMSFPYYHHLDFLHPLLHRLWTPGTIFFAVLVIIWSIYFWDNYLSFRQYKITRKTASVPSELASIMDQVSYNKARSYQLDRLKFGFACGLWENIIQTIVLVCNGIPYLWKLSGHITARFGYGREHEITQTLIFMLVASIINTLISLPFSIYGTFVIEERHGFNKQTPSFYVKDKIKKFIVMQAITLPCMSCVIHIVKLGGDFFFIYLWLFCVVVSLILVTVYADYIAPLFDKFVPLPEGELRKEIEKLAASINFPLAKLYVVEGSKRSAHSNAYFYGFFKNKRIVLFDTLLKDYVPSDSEKKKDEKEKEEIDEKEKEETNEKEKKEKKDTGCTDEEIIAILAHELGHWKLNHVVKNVVIAQVNLFLCFAVFALLFKDTTLYEAFGFYGVKPVIIGLVIIFQYIFSPYNEILSFLMTILSRRFEFQADMFAKLLNKASALRSGLIKLNQDNLTFPVHDWLYSAYNHSHPPLLQRIRALGKLD